MSLDEEDAHLLIDIGFTKNQAKIYLKLLKLGVADGKTIANVANTPKPVVYRTLGELQKIGLVEKEIAFPYKFRATPVKQGLQILVNQSLESHEDKREKIEQFLIRKQHTDEEDYERHRHRLTVVEGKERIIQLIKMQHNDACENIDILSTFPRWLRIIQRCLENYKENLARNVHHRILVSKPEGKATFPDEVKTLLSDPNLELKVTRANLVNNLGIFDGKQATFNFFPSKPLRESPIIWTNHPSFVAMAQDHFDKIWKSTRKYIR